MRFVIVLLFLLVSTVSKSQVSDSIIYLNEIIIDSHPPKIKVIKSKKSDFSFCVIDKDSRLVSLVKDIPEGKFRSVKLFYSNRLDASLGDIDFQFIIYEVGKDLMPGNELTGDAVYFKLPTDRKKGNIELDLSTLNLDTQKEVYIGFKALIDFKGLFCISCRSADHQATVWKHKDVAEWQKWPDTFQIKLDLKVDVE